MLVQLAASGLDGSGVNARLTRAVGAIRYQTGVTAQAGLAAMGFLGATPATRQAHVADPSGGATVDSQARTAINAILATLETFGLHATSRGEK